MHALGLSEALKRRVRTGDSTEVRTRRDEHCWTPTSRQFPQVSVSQRCVYSCVASCCRVQRGGMALKCTQAYLKRRTAVAGQWAKIRTACKGMKKTPTLTHTTLARTHSSSQHFLSLLCTLSSRGQPRAPLLSGHGRLLSGLGSKGNQSVSQSIYTIVAYPFLWAHTCGVQASLWLQVDRRPCVTCVACGCLLSLNRDNGVLCCTRVSSPQGCAAF
jgi:hypothetical protein